MTQNAIKLSKVGVIMLGCAISRNRSHFIAISLD